MEEKILQEIGLTENESRVYIFLLENTQSSITEIANSLPIHRVNLYDILKRLTEKGLVSSILEGKSKKYTSTDPSYLLKKLQEKENLLKTILPNLESRKNKSEKKNEVAVFQGKKGIKAILEDTLKQKKQIQIFGAQGNFAEKLPFYFIHYNKKRQKLNLKLKIIHSEKIRKWRIKNPLPCSEVRFIPEFYNSPSTTFIYGKKVAIVMWLDTPIGILIDSQKLANSYLTFFSLLWKISKK